MSIKGFEAGSNPEISFGYLLNSLDRLRKKDFSNPEEGIHLADVIRRGVEEGIATWKSLKTGSDELDRLVNGDNNFVEDGMAEFERAIREQEARFDERMKKQIVEIRNGDEPWGVASIRNLSDQIAKRVKEGVTTWEKLQTTEQELKALANAKIKRK